MRKFILPLLILLLAVSVVFNVRHFASRQSSPASASSTRQEVWTCPMDPQVRQDHPGKCPICGMNLVLQKDAQVTEVVKEPSSAKPKIEAKAAEQYQCPMHPTIIRDHPGDCPICGMKLVKMKAPAASETNETSDNSGDVDNRVAVTIDPMRQQLIGLRTAAVMRDAIGTEWNAVGRVQADPTRVSKINVKVSGYVERVYVDFAGQSVEHGEQLFSFYSPDLLALQQEYLLALQAQKAAANRDPAASDSVMLMAARQKLKLWDVPDALIERLERSGKVAKALTFASPVTGVVTAKNIVEGSYLNPGEVAYEVTDLSAVWIIADAYQSDAARVSVGMTAAIALESLPNRALAGRVSFIDPVLDPQSRTFKVRINLDNKNGELKPDMFTDVRFQGATHPALTIPTDAVIPTGRGNMVFVSAGNGKFEPRAVKLGEASSGRVEVVEGVREGELVVTRANFLIDSESSLRAALAAVGGAQ